MAEEKKETIGVRFPVSIIARINEVSRASARASAIGNEPDQSTVIRGLVQRALPLVEAELGITPGAPSGAPSETPAAPERQGSLPFAAAPAPTPPAPAPAPAPTAAPAPAAPSAPAPAKAARKSAKKAAKKRGK
jgi:DNA polymerase-3 subunit gamma/tau